MPEPRLTLREIVKMPIETRHRVMALYEELEQAEARAAAAEADATWQKTANEALTTAGNAMKKRLEAEAAALREKAALADNHASHLRTRRKIAAGISNLSISEDYWLARYDALGPTHESEDER